MLVGSDLPIFDQPIKDLLFKKFDTSVPAAKTPYKSAASEIPDSPPFVTGRSTKETKRIKALLLKAFDLKAVAPAAAKKKAPAKKTAAKKAPAKKTVKKDA